MPYLNGLEFCELLKEDPRTKEIPVVLLSAEKSQETVLAAKDAGAAEFLLKPVMLGELSALLRRVVGFEAENSRD